jgi:hypothetical protein
MEALTDREMLAERVRQRLRGREVVVKRMFGGLAFMLEGNMLCCVSGKGLMARVGAAQEAEALRRPHAAPCAGTGRPMAGFVMVSPPGLATEAALDGWLDLALAYVTTLPAKADGGASRKPGKRATAR